MLKRMGWTRKKIGGWERARGVLEGCLEDAGRQRSRDRRPERLVFVDLLGAPTPRSLPSLRVVTQRVASAPEGAAQLLGQERDPALASMTQIGRASCRERG